MSIQQTLEQALRKLQIMLGLGLDLRVEWHPSPQHALSGEVRNQILYVYEVTEDKAMMTLYHEVVDYHISQAIMPYQQVTNALIKMWNQEAYARKERIVEALVNLIKKNVQAVN